MKRQAGVLVVAKAPVPGEAKTRLGEQLGAVAAADLAAASLLDTLDACEAFAPARARLIALTGDLRSAQRGAEITQRLRSWTVVDQAGETFAERLVRAHRDAATLLGDEVAVVQIGMDTPQLRACDLASLADAVDDFSDTCCDAALGPAADGGWWGLSTRKSGYVDQLVDVPMSRPDTCRETLRALVATGATVGFVHELVDVDSLDDAIVVAAYSQQTRFARTLREVWGGARSAAWKDRERVTPCQAQAEVAP